LECWSLFKFVEEEDVPSLYSIQFLSLLQSTPSTLIIRLKERERKRERERERESGAVGATSTPFTVGLFSFLTMLFLPTFSQH